MGKTKNKSRHHSKELAALQHSFNDCVLSLTHAFTVQYAVPQKTTTPLLSFDW